MAFLWETGNGAKIEQGVFSKTADDRAFSSAVFPQACFRGGFLVRKVCETAVRMKVGVAALDADTTGDLAGQRAWYADTHGCLFSPGPGVMAHQVRGVHVPRWEKPGSEIRVDLDAKAGKVLFTVKPHGRRKKTAKIEGLPREKMRLVVQLVFPGQALELVRTQLLDVTQGTLAQILEDLRRAAGTGDREMLVQAIQDAKVNEVEGPELEAAEHAYQAFFTSIQWKAKQELDEARKNGGATPWRGARVMLVGEGRAGKTSTVKSLLGKEFDADEESTIGAALESCEIERREDVLGWTEQTIGSEMARAMLQLAEKGAQDLAGREEFEELSEEKKKQQRNFTKDEAPGPDFGPDPGDAGAAGADAVGDVSRTIGEEDEQLEETDGAPVEAQDAHEPLDMEEPAVDLAQEEDLAAVDEAIRKLADVEFALGPGEERLAFNIWDFGGQEVFYAMQHLFLTRFGLYLIVFQVPMVADPAQRPRALRSLKFWLQSVMMHANGAPALLVGTCIDQLPDDRAVDDRLREVDRVLKREVGGLYSYIYKNTAEAYKDFLFFPVNNAEKVGIADLKKGIDTAVREDPLEYIDTKVPIAWRQAYDALSKTGKRILKFEDPEVRDISETYLSGGAGGRELPIMLTFFHDLGSLLYFGDAEELKHLIVMDPQWLVDGISTVICDAKGISPLHTKALNIAKSLNLEQDYRKLADHGRATRLLLEALWKDQKTPAGDDVYDTDHRSFFIGIMQRMQLICPMEKGYLVPNMLPKELEPSAIATALGHDTWGGWPRFCMDFSVEGGFLPVGLFDRLVCLLARSSSVFRRDDDVVSRTRALIFGYNTNIILENAEEDHKIWFSVGSRETGWEARKQLERVALFVDEHLRRLREQFAKGLAFEAMEEEDIGLGETRLNILESKIPKEKEWIVCSTPGMGPEEYKGQITYTFDVMSALKVLTYWKIIDLGYDWKGSTNKYPEDDRLWGKVFCTFPAPSFEQKAKWIYQTKWFGAYKGQVKGAVRQAALQRKAVKMVCIEGGPISQAEKAAMSDIHREIKQDLWTGCSQLDADVDIEIVNYETYQDFEKVIDPVGLMEAQANQLDEAGQIQAEIDRLNAELPQLEAKLQEELAKSEERTAQLAEKTELQVRLQTELDESEVDRTKMETERATFAAKLQELTDGLETPESLQARLEETRLEMEQMQEQMQAEMEEMRKQLEAEREEQQKFQEKVTAGEAAAAETAKMGPGQAAIFLQLFGADDITHSINQEAWEESFERIAKDGNITRKAFVLARGPPEVFDFLRGTVGVTQPHLTRDNFMKAFHILDADGDGEIGKMDLAQACADHAA